MMMMMMMMMMTMHHQHNQHDEPVSIVFIKSARWASPAQSEHYHPQGLPCLSFLAVQMSLLAPSFSAVSFRMQARFFALCFCEMAVVPALHANLQLLLSHCSQIDYPWFLPLYPLRFVQGVCQAPPFAEAGTSCTLLRAKEHRNCRNCCEVPLPGYSLVSKTLVLAVNPLGCHALGTFSLLYTHTHTLALHDWLKSCRIGRVVLTTWFAMVLGLVVVSVPHRDVVLWLPVFAAQHRLMPSNAWTYDLSQVWYG